VFDLIKALCDLDGPVGQEQAVLDYIEPIWQAAGATTERTKIGNVLGRTSGEGPRLLLVAHADELCYLVRAVDPDGFLWLANGQGWERQTSVRNWFTVGQRVRILARSGVIPGVIAAATGHVATLTLPEPGAMTWNDLWVETGLSAAELRVRGVTPGTRVIWDSPVGQLGEHIVGKALDDRAPLAVITEVLRRVPAAERAWNITLGCSVQEEIGLIGAAAIAAHERFDAAIVVEIGLAGDIPAVDPRMMPLRLGGGPVLVHKDSLVHYDHALTMALESVAKQQRMLIQHAIFGSFGSDGAALMKADIPSALVAFPARYTHSPFETAHLRDLEELTEWLCAFVRTPYPPA
jgi:putative aminopeptidase FrvX